MEKFLNLKIGMTLKEVESILNRELVIEHHYESYFKRDVAAFKDEGVTIGFKPNSQTLYLIRFEHPFSLPIDGVRLGSSKEEVRKIKGDPTEVNPFPDQPRITWIYGKLGEPNCLRFDFEKSKNGKCEVIYK